MGEKIQQEMWCKRCGEVVPIEITEEALKSCQSKAPSKEHIPIVNEEICPGFAICYNLCLDCAKKEPWWNLPYQLELEIRKAYRTVYPKYYYRSKPDPEPEDQTWYWNTE